MEYSGVLMPRREVSKRGVGRAKLAKQARAMIAEPLIKPLKKTNHL